MIRLIKRYESRKLYDTEESRYVSLEEMAEWIRTGQEIRVVDNATGAEVTAQTLTQLILEEGRRGVALSSELLHDLVRLGERAMTRGVETVQQAADRFVQRSVDRLTPVKQAREEMSELRRRLEELETTLSGLDHTGATRAKPTARAKSAARAQPATAARAARRTASPSKRSRS